MVVPWEMECAGGCVCWDVDGVVQGRAVHGRGGGAGVRAMKCLGMVSWGRGGARAYEAGKRALLDWRFVWMGIGEEGWRIDSRASIGCEG
jgi:hypothetical protein